MLTRLLRRGELGLAVVFGPPGILAVGEEVKVVSYGRDLGVHWATYRVGD